MLNTIRVNNNQGFLLSFSSIATSFRRYNLGFNFLGFSPKKTSLVPFVLSADGSAIKSFYSSHKRGSVKIMFFAKLANACNNIFSAIRGGDNESLPVPVIDRGIRFLACLRYANLGTGFR